MNAPTTTPSPDGRPSSGTIALWLLLAVVAAAVTYFVVVDYRQRNPDPMAEAMENYRRAEIQDRADRAFGGGR